jgi:hypothetical protein
MSDVKSTTIVPIGVYCFLLAAYFLFLAVYPIWRNKTIGYDSWFFGTIFIVLAVVYIVVGIGIINLNKWCWRVLFFSLGISISSVCSLVIIILIFLTTHSEIFAPYFNIIQKAAGGWIVFLSYSLAGIIVLCNLVSYDVVSYFGQLGPLISPIDY